MCCSCLLSGNGDAGGGHLLDAHSPPADGSGERPEVHSERWKQNHWHRPGHRHPEGYRRRTVQLGLKGNSVERAGLGGGYPGGVRDGECVVVCVWSNQIIIEIYKYSTCTKLKQERTRRNALLCSPTQPKYLLCLALSSYLKARLSELCHLCNKMYLKMKSHPLFCGIDQKNTKKNKIL